MLIIMRISKIIEKLEEIKEKYGDLECYSPCVSEDEVAYKNLIFQVGQSTKSHIAGKINLYDEVLNTGNIALMLSDGNYGSKHLQETVYEYKSEENWNGTRNN